MSELKPYEVITMLARDKKLWKDRDEGFQKQYQNMKFLLEQYLTTVEGYICNIAELTKYKNISIQAHHDYLVSFLLPNTWVDYKKWNAFYKINKDKDSEQIYKNIAKVKEISPKEARIYINRLSAKGKKYYKEIYNLTA